MGAVIGATGGAAAAALGGVLGGSPVTSAVSCVSPLASARSPTTCCAAASGWARSSAATRSANTSGSRSGTTTSVTSGNHDGIAVKAALDGLYPIRSSVGADKLSSEELVRSYKLLVGVERAFKTMKSSTYRSVRSITGWPTGTMTDPDREKEPHPKQPGYWFVRGRTFPGAARCSRGGAASAGSIRSSTCDWEATGAVDEDREEDKLVKPFGPESHQFHAYPRGNRRALAAFDAAKRRQKAISIKSPKG